MQICFFEEFPQKKWEKLKYISWNSKIYVAAPSLKDFLKLKSQILKHKKIRKIVYWPILQKKEGYWISPFSRKSALEHFLAEKKKATILKE